MANEKCPNLEANKQQCACTYTECERHGTCCECLRYHLSTNSLPACVKKVAQVK